MRLILPAQDIPDGSKVTKINGVAEFILQSEVKVYAYLDARHSSRPARYPLPVGV